MQHYLSIFLGSLQKCNYQYLKKSCYCNLFPHKVCGLESDVASHTNNYTAFSIGSNEINFKNQMECCKIVQCLCNSSALFFQSTPKCQG